MEAELTSEHVYDDTLLDEDAAQHEDVWSRCQLQVHILLKTYKYSSHLSSMTPLLPGISAAAALGHQNGITMGTVDIMPCQIHS